MDDSTIVSQLEHLQDDATIVTKSTNSSYQSFLQQLNQVHSPPELYNCNSRLVNATLLAAAKEDNTSTIHVYHKSPPSYNESQSQQANSNAESANKCSGDNLLNSKTLNKDHNIQDGRSELLRTPDAEIEFNDKLICELI